MGDFLYHNQGGHQEGGKPEANDDSTSDKDWWLGKYHV